MMDRSEATKRSPAASIVPLPAPLASCNLAERIERALVLLAYFIELDGDVHIPMYEKFEAELDELQRQQATRQRARERLSRFQRLRRSESDTVEELEL